MYERTGEEKCEREGDPEERVPERLLKACPKKFVQYYKVSAPAFAISFPRLDELKRENRDCS